MFYIEVSGAKFYDKLYFEAQVEFSSLSNSEKFFHFLYNALSIVFPHSNNWKLISMKI
jgi:hypothetical protein